jgi:hypothetical protein
MAAMSVIETMSHTLDDFVLGCASLIDSSHAQVLLYRDAATHQDER